VTPTRGPSSGRPIVRRDIPSAKFSARVVRRSVDACWEYKGAKNPSGYGMFSLDGSPWPAHRLAYALEYGEVPAGAVVMHACDNPPCCNPRHLRLGTQLENMRDAIQKGRWKVAECRRLVLGGRCKRRHRLSPKNTRTRERDGWITCLSCVRLSRRRAAKKAQQARQAHRSIALNAIRQMLVGDLPTDFGVVVALVGERRARIFAHAYGLDGETIESNTVTALRYGISRERVRQIIRSVEGHLKLARSVSRRPHLRLAA
jgi:hypothetical protein